MYKQAQSDTTPMNSVEIPTTVADSDAKLSELMLYISKQCESQSTFGAVKLNKILFFADFSSFIVTGKAITGAEYMRLPKGPEPRNLRPVRDSLIENQRAILQEKAVWNGFVQHRLIPLSEPNLSFFSAEEIDRVNQVIEKLSNHTAAQVSDLSHQFLAWEIAEDGEEIPYEAAFLINEKPSVQDIRKALELVEG